MKNITGVRAEDYSTFKEYNKARMRVVNRRKHFEQRKERYSELAATVIKYYDAGYNAEQIGNILATEYKYKLTVDRDIDKMKEVK